ncbi:SGNH/GDSL hydrolase family protein [Pseudonocardia bannensis]|uniref:SGNH hydrolase n=1 Tax=Pseudonocardia bannensis TaxID=630973 RepID=A0A848DP91_9PSEU|nr:SGNH/GDSL hydrolase family protein [Pseudonocardia bannensis]NMH94592.1 SGNH hydrolase [Pseudonocardia bannensis]
MRIGVGRSRVVLGVFTLLLVGALPSGRSTPEAAAKPPASVRIVASLPAGAPVPAPLRVMPLGASSTEGVGSPATAGYRGPLSELLRHDGVAVDFVGSKRGGPASLADRDHEGHSGWTIAMLAPRVAAWLRATRPDVVLLHAGTNDLGAGASGAVVAGRLDDLLNRIYTAAPRTHVIVAGVWATMRSRSAARADLAARTPRVVARHHTLGHSIDFVDTTHLLSPSDFTDSLHANASGYRKIAAMWDREIEAYLAARRAASTP